MFAKEAQCSYLFAMFVVYFVSGNLEHHNFGDSTWDLDFLTVF